MQKCAREGCEGCEFVRVFVRYCKSVQGRCVRGVSLCVCLFIDAKVCKGVNVRLINHLIHSCHSVIIHYVGQIRLYVHRIWPYVR